MTAADRWVVGAALALVASLYVWSWGGVSGSNAPGGSDAAGVLAEVVVAGHPIEAIDLGHDGEVEVQGRMGPSRLLVQDGRVRFTASPCRGKQCIHSGWLAHEGDFAACLPNGVAVEVLGPERGLDAINY
ncbi:MAG: NusG domain II-containing protein [Gammaproteobacteria bacterium]